MQINVGHRFGTRARMKEVQFRVQYWRTRGFTARIKYDVKRRSHFVTVQRTLGLKTKPRGAGHGQG